MQYIKHTVDRQYIILSYVKIFNPLSSGEFLRVLGRSHESHTDLFLFSLLTSQH